MTDTCDLIVLGFGVAGIEVARQATSAGLAVTAIERISSAENARTGGARDHKHVGGRSCGEELAGTWYGTAARHWNHPRAP
jgi:choline dehydrogenase-like flavoprotein